jgi:RNA polymerase sigma-70 factor (ECF subfamily)
METVSDEWLERARNGDAEAFAQAFESLRASVYAVAVRLAGPDDADDVTMETFLRAWQAIGQFNGRSSLKSWLYRIAHNCAIDAIRKRSRRREVLPAPDDDGRGPMERIPDANAPLPARELERGELRDELDQALQKLPTDHRLVILLRYSDGLSYGEIAAAAGLPIGTVMSRLFNGKRKLQNLLKAGGRHATGHE